MPGLIGEKLGMTQIFDATGKWVPVTVIAAVTTGVHFYVTPMSVPGATTIHGILSVALGLLLVFRTNQSYDRWWEGRKLWGAMVNTCRNLARSATVHLAKHPE